MWNLKYFGFLLFDELAAADINSRGYNHSSWGSSMVDRVAGVLKTNAPVLLAYECQGWQAEPFDIVPGQLFETGDKKLGDLYERKAQIHSRYKYNRCTAGQHEYFNQTVYRGIAGHRVLYFEVKHRSRPYCTMLTVYRPPRYFLRPVRFSINLCLGIMIYIRNNAINVHQLLEFSFKDPIPQLTYIIVGIKTV